MDGRQEEIHNILVALLSGDEKEIYKVLYKKKEIDDKTPKQAAADITGQLQVRPMLYTLYIDINLLVVKMLHTRMLWISSCLPSLFFG